jgi:hypothetical protein
MKYVHLHHNYIKPEWKILHVGGGKQPFRRANVVLDNMPYCERSKDSSWVQTIPEYFSENTWYQQPLEQLPWPFQEEEFDLVIIDNALVMSRDPVGICGEMERVGKRGFIEIPTPTMEHTRGLTNPNLTGFEAHRWIASVENSKIRFVYKHPTIHTNPDFYILPPENSKFPFINPKFATQGIFWDTVLEAYEDFESFEFPDWYFEENVWKHRDVIGTITSAEDFWDPNAKVPVLLETLPFKPDKLVLLDSVPKTFLLNLFSENGQRNTEILKFEQLLLMKIRKEET